MMLDGIAQCMIVIPGDCGSAIGIFNVGRDQNKVSHIGCIWGGIRESDR